jgi:hypothetical protein
MKQPLRARHRHQRRDLPSTARLAEDRHEVRIAAEAVDVVAHPLQRQDDVQHAGGAGERELRSGPRGVGEAEHVQPVVDRDDHDVARFRQAGAVEHRAEPDPSRSRRHVQPSMTGRPRPAEEPA